MIELILYISDDLTLFLSLLGITLTIILLVKQIHSHKL